MRDRKVKNGITVKGYSGTTSIMLAMDIAPKLKKDLLGFSIQRINTEKDGSERRVWLQGALQFPNANITSYGLVDSSIAPIQKFRWSDYTVYSDMEYRYKVYATYGKTISLKRIEGPEIKLRTEPLDKGLHQIIFNRAVAASQAYERKFSGVNPDDTKNPLAKEAQKWLSRGLKEKIESFMGQASGKDFKLEMAIYEFELEDFAKVITKCLKGKAEVRIVYHSKKGDEQTKMNEKFLKDLPDNIKVKRLTKKIFHQKFIVLSKKDSSGNWKAKKVLTGTTNFTPNGVYRQANVIHVIEDPKIAEKYSSLFKIYLDLATKYKSIDKSEHSRSAIKEIKDYINTNSIINDTDEVQVVFCPRSKYTDITELEKQIKGTKSDMIFCSAFSIHANIVNALKPDKKSTVIRYGLQNSKSTITGVHRNQSFTVPAFLKTGIEDDLKKSIFKKESTHGQKGNIYIHLKSMALDFTTKNPTVIFGSHNFSKPASDSNDENMVIIKGNTSVADVYMTEMFRLYDHYRFRYNQKEGKAKKSKIKSLAPDDSWTKPYFDKEQLEYDERIRFAK